MSHPLEQQIGYTFRNGELMHMALTHPSITHKPNNQRLEFLGDGVLGLIVARLLYDLYPKEAEGELARRQAALVCGETLAAIAREMKLGQHMLLAASEETTGGRDNATNLEDVCEALIGALYLDGGLEAAEAFILPYWKTLAGKLQAPPKDAKTRLQEWAQARGLPIPEYIVTEQTGPAHAPYFTITVRVEDQESAAGTAGNKRAAEQEAASRLLAKLEG